MALPLALALAQPALSSAQRVEAATPKVSAPIIPPAIVATYRNDGQRTGINMTETAFLTTGANALSMKTFGKIYSRPVDGAIYTQPLYVPNVPFPNVEDLATNTPKSGLYNAVFVCTSHNSIYAFDAGGSAKLKDGSSTNKNIRVSPLWKVNYN